MASLPVARTNANNTVLDMLVDSGSTGHYLASDLIPGLQNRMVDYKELDETHKIANVGHHALEGIGTGTISGGVTNQDGNEHHTEFSGTIVPGLGQCLFTVPAAASMGAVAVFDAAKPRLKIGTVTTPCLLYTSPSPRDS